MAISQNQRLRKAAAKAARRKAVVAQKQVEERRELAISKPRHIDFAASPIRECLITEEAFEAGIATVIVARNLSGGRVGAAVFLVDLWCRGVKDAFFRVQTGLDFEEMVTQAGFGRPLVPIEPAAARRLLRGAVEYAAALGLSPAPEYVETEAIFGGIQPSDKAFVYGQDGQPLYIAGPNDSPRLVRRIMGTLRDRLGPDGFHFIAPIGDLDDDSDYGDDSDPDDEDFDEIEGELGKGKGPERLARRIEAEPGDAVEVKDGDGGRPGAPARPIGDASHGAAEPKDGDDR